MILWAFVLNSENPYDKKQFHLTIKEINKDSLEKNNLAIKMRITKNMFM